MKIYNNIIDFKKVPNPIVTIGTFDGVHIGHQAILKDMVASAKKIAGETVVITFYPHPRQVLNIDKSNICFITTQDEKIKHLEEVGIDNLIIINFTKEFSRISSEEFIRNYIVDKIHPVKFVIGYDHHFGKNRMGNLNLLYDFGMLYHFDVECIPMQDIGNIIVSSTKIRHYLQEGDLEHANNLLGYQYSYIGTVVHGSKVGREVGYRTANLDVKPEFRLIERSGVYATYVDYNGKTYKSMTYIGRRPTFGENNSESIEVHLIDFDGDLYGKTIKVRFVSLVRYENKFDNIKNLEKQIESDENKIRELLK